MNTRVWWLGLAPLLAAAACGDERGRAPDEALGEAASPLLVVHDQGKLVPDDGALGHQFGSAVALDGDTAVLGAYKGNGAVTGAGAAYVFTRTSAMWTQAAKLVAPSGMQMDEFGASVAISGDTVVVGARRESLGAQLNGAVHVYVRSGGMWQEQAAL